MLLKFFFCCCVRLSSLSPTVFSSHINQNHLDESLSQLLYLYSEIHFNNPELLHQTNYVEIEALHVILSTSEKGLPHALQLQSQTKSQRVIRTAIEISISVWLCNFIRAHRLARSLPLIFQLAYRIRFSNFRSMLLEVCERSHRSPQGSKFPLEKLSKYLLFDSLKETADFCSHHGLLLDETSSFVVFKTGVHFKSGSSFQSNIIADPALLSGSENVSISKFLYGQSV